MPFPRSVRKNPRSTIRLPWSLLLSAALTSAVVLLPAAEPGRAPDPDQARVAVEALRRLKGIDLEANPALKSALLKVLESVRGTAQYVELVEEFGIEGQSQALLAYALDRPDEPAAVDALRLVLAAGDLELVRTALRERPSAQLIELLAKTSGKDLVPLLSDVAETSSHALELRKSAVRALAQTLPGAERLLAFRSRTDTPAELRAFIRAELVKTRWPEIRARALDAEQGADLPAALPLPSQLAGIKGDAARGREVFARETIGCSQCHQVQGRGTDFGPNLSEIGTKLAKEALYDAILDPSAGISFGYEAWQLELKNGDEAYGLLASETADEIAIKTQNGVVTRYPKAEIARKAQMRTSIMPAGLAQLMSTDELIDLVEYLSTLRKNGPLTSTGTADEPSAATPPSQSR